jgi:D-alanyl-D-alanine carboxypeptidase
MKRNETLEINTPFHIASVGKLFTATIIYQLVEEGRIALTDPISLYLKAEILEDLFVIEGIDYSERVTIEQLLKHTSGVADYFGGPVIQGKTMETIMRSVPDKIWTPIELVDFSAKNQTPLGIPDEVYGYSDTGYILLGLLIEEVTKTTFEINLQDRFFIPLKMNQTYMAMRQGPLSNDRMPIADIWLEGYEIGDSNVLSVDWAGGGLISTLEDLLTFQKALQQGDIIEEKSLRSLFSDENQFEQGIYTGTGGMTLHFNKFSPFLKLPAIEGHIGILSTYLFYEKESDTYIVMNYGSTDKMVDGVMALIEILNTVNRIQ